MNKSRTTANKPNSPDSAKSATPHAAPPPDGTRETIESIAMAIILALIFRSFVAEAFVIPTGSMAPTLVGRHKDVYCPQCGYRYQAGASNEVNKEGSPVGVYVIGTVCPLCRYPNTLDLFHEPNQDSFSGDRIIVGKFAYDFAEPKRWDVIVFKFPGNARDNYIKRLVGLPGERLRIAGGNVYIRGNESQPFKIARKPPEKLNVLLEPVYDSHYLAPALEKANWPHFWYATDETGWKRKDDGHHFEINSQDGQMHWLRYKHLLPNAYEWEKIEQEKPVADDVANEPGGLIADFCAYNAGLWISPPNGILKPDSYDPSEPITQILGTDYHDDAIGMHWVDDLAVDCDVEVTSTSGTIALELIRGGTHYRCAIDIATGTATLRRIDHEGKDLPFVGDEEGAAEVLETSAATVVKGPGKYRLRLSNADHQLLLWVNGSVVEFDHPTTYASAELIDPFWSPTDPGDTEPALIGCQGGALNVQRLAVLRDKYYIAASHQTGREVNDYTRSFPEKEVAAILAEPAEWQSSQLFSSRRGVDFIIPPDCFFPMGDNSPHSQDARLWADDYRLSPLPPNNPYPVPPYVKRDLLVGKAFMVYWPHSWNRPYLWPNFSRMKWIR